MASSDSDRESGPSTPKKAKFQVVRYKTKFRPEISHKYPCIIKGSSDYEAKCTVCDKCFGVGHQGKRDVERHMSSASHIKKVKEKEENTSVTQFFRPVNDATDRQVMKAEVMFVGFLLEHNLPFQISDHTGKLFRNMFSDSKIAKVFSCGHTKSSVLINDVIGPSTVEPVVNFARDNPFSIAIDGGNDNDIKKMYPVSVRIYDVNRGKVFPHLLKVAMAAGATAQDIFDAVDGVMEELSIPWNNCVGLAFDNTSVNTGKNNSLMTRVLAKASHVYVNGCACHMAHNCCRHAYSQFMSRTDFDLDDFLTDLFFWFHHSSKRKACLNEFYEFCDIESRKLLKHTNTRWMSMESCVQRVLSVFPALKSYFKSESFREARFKRLQASFNDDMTEVYLLFMQSVFPAFSSFILALEHESPCIFMLKDLSTELVRKILGKFVKLSELQTCNPIEINYEEHMNQVSDSQLFIGMTTKQLLRKLTVSGDVDIRKVDQFYDAVRAFYVDAVNYFKRVFPFDDPVLDNAVFVDYRRKHCISFENVEYFVNRFSQNLHVDLDALHEEFVEYSLFSLPPHITNQVTNEGVIDPFSMDLLWYLLGNLKKCSGELTFPNLAQVAKLVLTLPHSNAESERVFSMAKKNKTTMRNSLKDETLSNILCAKINLFSKTACHDYQPTNDLLAKAKKATWCYNKLHMQGPK